MTSYHLAHINIASRKFPLESEEMADFVNNLDRINALAEKSPGFVWRFKSDDDDPAESQIFGPKILVNMSVWEDVASLHHYVFHTDHIEIMRRRREWFERMNKAFSVIWWVPQGHIPSLHEALEKLEYFDCYGETKTAFTFKMPFPPPNQQIPSQDRDHFENLCPAT